MKRFKILSILLAFVFGFCLAFAACADGTGGTDNNTTTSGTGGADNRPSGNTGNIGGSGNAGQGDSSTPSAPSGGVLVVYFSATNNTEKIAGYIADITGATQFELVPQDPYSGDDLNYNNRESRVYKEYADQSLRNVALEKSTPDNWEDYETVFIGYPIWWGIAAWPVNGFIKANDFTGKTVVPFCTSASSGIGQSDTLLKEMAGTGDWKAGRRFSSSSSKGDVQTWIAGLNL